MINEIGIYKITNIVNQKCYIGSTKSIYFRFLEHKRDLKLNIHHSTALQNAYNKYGEQSFKFEILEECEIERLIAREQYYIDSFKPEYNICQIAGSNLGYQHTTEAKERMSKSRKGKSFHTQFQIDRIKETHIGKVVSVETRRLRSRAVQQLDLETEEVVAEFYSIAEASRQTKIYNIGVVLIGRQNKSGNYKWKYKE